MIRSLAATARDPATTSDDLRSMPSTLVHSVGGIVMWLVVLILNVYKPQGLTRYGWQKRERERVDADERPG